jgi:hypothetical protein
MSIVSDLSKHPILKSMKNNSKFSINDKEAHNFEMSESVAKAIEEIKNGTYSFLNLEFATGIHNKVYSLLFNQLLDSEPQIEKDSYTFFTCGETYKLKFSN